MYMSKLGGTPGPGSPQGPARKARHVMVTVTLRRTVIKQCPYRVETDTGELVIVLDGDAPELHDLAIKADALCAEPITHEQFTERLAAILPAGARITTNWTTGPWDVQVEATGAIPR